MDIDSIFHLYKKTYFNLPRSVQTFFGEIYGAVPLEVRFGKQYKTHKETIKRFEQSDNQFKQEYMFNKTYETLQFAYDNIPYYKKVFDLHDFKLKDFKSLSDIKKIPYLTKEIIQSEIDSLYTDKIDKPVVIHTGGSTFTPTKFYVPLNTSRAKEKAYTLSIFSKLGYKNRDKILVLRDLHTSDKSHNKYWDYEKVDNRLRLSADHINSIYIEKMLGEIKRFSPKYIYAYPSTVMFFIKACKDIGINKLKGIKGVFLSSEISYSYQIDQIKSFFNCEVLSHYGHSERSSVGFRIDHQPYSFLNSYGLTRIVENEIITTTFDNFVMPFINYKTKDFTTGNYNFIDETDVVNDVGNIEGRLQEFLVTKHGTLRSVMSVGMGHYDGYDYVESAQYYQDTPGYIIVNIESKHPDKVDVTKIIKELEEFVNYEISFAVKFVDKIKKTSRGKWKSCIQKLNIEKYK